MRKFFDYMDRYLVDTDFKMTISKRGVHIVNYQEIEDFSSSRVIVCYDSGRVIISGSDLVVSKMLDDEVLITGKVVGIEYN